MTWDEQIRAELASLLAAYLHGDASLDDVLGFEASLAHDCELAADLRCALGKLALIGEEVEADWRPAADFDEQARLALSALSEATASLAAAD